MKPSTIDDRVRRAVACLEPRARIEEVEWDPEMPELHVVRLENASNEKLYLPVPGSLEHPSILYFAGEGFEVGYAEDRSEPYAQRRGFALFDDGSALALNDPDGMRAFYRRAHPWIDPLRLAHMLAGFHAEGEIVTDPHQLDVYELDTKLSEAPGFTLPSVDGTELSFCTVVVRSGGYMVRWDVRGLDGDLTWERGPVAVLREAKSALLAADDQPEARGVKMRAIDVRVRRAIACLESRARIAEVWCYRSMPGLYVVELEGASSHRLYFSVPGAPDAWAFRGEGFEVGHAVDTMSPPLSRRGFALFDDGSALLLNDPEGLRALYRRARPRIEPIRLAHILARYHGEGEVVTDPHELDKFDVHPKLSEAPGFTLPRVDGTELSFCTTAFRMGADVYDMTRWHVHGLDGELSWETEPAVRLRRAEPDLEHWWQRWRR